MMRAFTIPVLVVLALVAATAHARTLPGKDQGIANEPGLAGGFPHLGGVYEPSAYGGVNPVTFVHESSIEPAVLDGVPVYNFTTVLEVADDLPVPSGPQDCNPAAPKIAKDGFPFLAARTYVFHGSSMPVLNQTVSEVTGFKSLAVDYNPCGHPPVGVFTVPHFDLHYFYMSNEDRMNMQCGGELLCFDTGANPKFFDVPEDMANLAEDFERDPMNVGVAEMGLHWWKQPVSAPWEEVTVVQGTYGGSVNFFELMFPAFGVPGGSARGIKYQSQTMNYLPVGYDVAYDGKTMSISIYVESKMF